MTVSSEEKKPKVHNEPRMGMNAMMRYMGATPAQRESIIRDQKYPPTFKTTWYEDACEACTRFIVGGMSDEQILTDAVSRIRSIVPASDAQETKNNSNIEAIEAFLGAYDRIDLVDLTPTRVANTTPSLLLSDVIVSVKPDIQLRGTYRGKEVAGAIKLYISKLHPLTEETGLYGAALLMIHQEDLPEQTSKVRKPSCMVFDVFTGACYRAPDASTLRVRDLEAACREIANRWPFILLPRPQ